MNPDLRIIPSGPEHDAPIAALTNRFIRETAVHFGTEEESAQDVASARTAAGDRYPWFVAELDGTFAGFARASAWRSRPAYRHTAEVALYVDERYRRRSIGTALYAELLKELALREYRTAIGAIALPNEASIRMHEAMGFEEVGVFREVGWKFGAWHDVLFMDFALSHI